MPETALASLSLVNQAFMDGLAKLVNTIKNADDVVGAETALHDTTKSLRAALRKYDQVLVAAGFNSQREEFYEALKDLDEKAVAYFTMAAEERGQIQGESDKEGSVPLPKPGLGRNLLAKTVQAFRPEKSKDIKGKAIVKKLLEEVISTTTALEKHMSARIHLRLFQLGKEETALQKSINESTAAGQPVSAEKTNDLKKVLAEKSYLEKDQGLLEKMKDVVESKKVSAARD